MSNKFNLLLDSRRNFEFMNPNINIISDIRKFSDTDFEFSDILVIVEESLNNSSNLLSLGFIRELYQLRIIIICNKVELIEIMKSYGEVFPISSDLLNYDVINSYLQGDLPKFESLFSEKYLKDANIQPDVELSLLRTLVDRYRVSVEELTKEVIVRVKEVNLEKEKNQELLNRYNSLFDRSVKSDIMMGQIAAFLSKSTYEILKPRDYINAPRIIYIKEYQELPNAFSLIDTIANSLRTILRNPTKVLIIGDSSSSRKIHYMPEHYIRIFDKYKKSDILAEDNIIKIGDSSGVLDIILENQVRTEILIVVDMNDSISPVLDYADINLVLARDLKKTAELGVKESIIITGKESDSNHWLEYPEAEELSSEDKFIYLSSRPIVQRVIESCRVNK